MKGIKKFSLTLLLLLVCIFSFAQDTSKVEMADELRGNGRIYVVVAVMLTILLGLIIYLVRLDRKISKLENQSHLQ